VIPVYAVVPSYGRECLKECLNSLINQVDLLFLIQTRDFPVPPHPRLACLPWDSSRELNISEWWNIGIKFAAVTANGRAEWDVLIVNDDVVAPPHLAAALSSGMREMKADLAWPPAAAGPRVGTVTGWCFMLRGESGIMADPQFHWWHGDDDIYLQALHAGGVTQVEGCQVRHLHPGGHDRQMAARTALDTEFFRKKWAL
jgi:hypothetical protein